jgi:hypothetical protein
MDIIVTLASSDASITVPDTVTITAGAFVADFTVNAVGIKNGNPATTGTVTTMFPDGHIAN